MATTSEHMSRFRSTARFDTPLQDAVDDHLENNDFHAREGDLTVFAADVPAEIEVGATERLEVGVRLPDAADVLDPDFCIPANLSAGLRVDVSMLLDGSEIAFREFCVPELNQADRVLSSRIEATQTGSVTLEAQVIGTDSRNIIATESWTIDIVEETTNGAADPTNGADNDDVECKGIIDAITKPECSFGDTVGAGAGVIAALFVVVALFALAAGS